MMQVVIGIGEIADFIIVTSIQPFTFRTVTAKLSVIGKFLVYLQHRKPTVK